MLQVKVPVKGSNGEWTKKVATLDPNDFYLLFSDLPSEPLDIRSFGFNYECPGGLKLLRIGRSGGGHDIEVKGLKLFCGDGKKTYHVRCDKHKVDLTCETFLQGENGNYTLHHHSTIPDKIIGNKKVLINVSYPPSPSRTSMPEPETS